MQNKGNEPAGTYSDRVGAVVVTFHPDQQVVTALIAELSRQCDQVVVVDNGSAPNQVHYLKDVAAQHHAHLIPLEDNQGIAAAQNRGIRWVREQGCTLVLLSDHDSVSSSTMVPRLVKALRLCQQRKKVAAVGPLVGEQKPGGDQLVYRARRWGPKRATPAELERPFLEVPFLIASGCLIDVRALDTVGVMNQGLFIDHVDLEWGLRARQAGWVLVVATGVAMAHSLGDKTVHIPGRAQPVHVHGTFRNYFLMRNTILLIKSGLLGWRWSVGYLIWMVKYAGFNCLVQDHRLERLRMVLRGLRDGLAGRTGPLHSGSPH